VLLLPLRLCVPAPAQGLCAVGLVEHHTLELGLEPAATTQAAQTPVNKKVADSAAKQFFDANTNKKHAWFNRRGVDGIDAMA
jgi:hypothetical protein